MFVKNKLEAAKVINAAISSHHDAWISGINTEKYLIDCEPPFSDEKMQAEGEHVSNWNFGKGRARTLKIVSENSSEVSKAISLCEIGFEKFDEKKHKEPLYDFLFIPEKRAEFGERIATCFVENVVKHMTILIRRAELDSFLVGYSPIVNDKNSIFPTAIPYTSIGFEDHTPVDRIETFVIFDVIKGSTIFNIFKQCEEFGDDQEMFGYEDCGEDPPTFCSNGWNRKVLKSIIFDIFNVNKEAICCLNGVDYKEDIDVDTLTRKYTSWEDVKVLAQNKGYGWVNLNINNRNIAKIYQITDDGEVHETYCFISGKNLDFNSKNLANVEYNIAYYKKSKNVTQDDFIVLIRDSTIDGSLYIHDIKGSGRIVAESSLRYDIYRNGLITSSNLNNALWMKEAGGISTTANPVKMLAGVVILDENVELVARTYQHNMRDAVELLNIEDSELSDAISYAQPNRKLSNRPNKDEVALVSSETDAIKKADIPYKLEAYGNILSIVIKNCLSKEISINLTAKDKKIVKDFKESVYEEFSDTDLSKEEIEKILYCINSVAISPVLSDINAISQAMNLASTASSRKRLLRMFLLALGFSRRQMKGIIETDEYGRDAELAAIENSMFEKTQEVVFGLGQDHITHLQGHFYKIEQKLKNAEAGEDPVACFNFVNNAIPNCELHVRAIAESPFFREKIKDYVTTLNLFKQSLKALASKLDKLKGDVENNQGNQSQLSAEEQARLAMERERMMIKIQMSAERAKAMHEFKVRGFDLDSEIKRMRAQADIEMKAAKNKADIEVNLSKKAAEMV